MDIGPSRLPGLWMQTISNREFARQLGVSETAVRRAEKSGRIRREPDGAWDLERVQGAYLLDDPRAPGGQLSGPGAGVGSPPLLMNEV
jgi:Transcriptional regulator, AbiEi antitoxin